MRGLDGRVAIVTGTTQMMGRAIAHRLCAEGVRVVGTGRNAEAGEAGAVGLRDAGGQSVFVAGDIGNPAHVIRLVAAAKDAYGPVDLVVNNAAGVDRIRAGAESAVADESLEEFEHQIRVGLYGPFLLAKEVLASMVERRRGVFVSVSAWNATRAVPAVTGYAATKAALEALDRQIARDYGSYGIRANSVLTGMIRVDQNQDMHDSPLGPEIRGQVQILPTIGEPDDIASAVAFLASDEAKFITGTTLAVEGGAIAKGGFPADLFVKYIAGLKQSQASTG
jgi:NAD(P)-dependent dehydrogenase (short-subunit alcohol dehydrogenase family)